MKTAIVLGMGTLGEAIAEKLVEKGFHVIGTVRPGKKYHRNSVETLELDVSDEQSIEKFLNKMAGKNISFFTSTIANNLTFKRFEDIPIQTFEEDLRINVLSHIKIIKGLGFEQDSNIVFILSEETAHPSKYMSSYVVSKYALLGLMKTLANELAAKKIRVNAISPGMMDTAFIKDLPPLLKDTYARKAGKLVDPKEVAQKIIEIMEKGGSGENVHAFGA